MSLVKEHPVDFDHFLQTALKDQDALQVKVSLLWQRVVLLQTDEFLRQFSQTTRYEYNQRCRSFSWPGLRIFVLLLFL